MILFSLSFFMLLFLGMPVCYCLLCSSVLYFLTNNVSLIQAVLMMFTSINENFILLSVPFFMLAGTVMNNSGITNKIFGFASSLVGWIPGGLAHANVVASVIFAGMSGTALADAGGLGSIELKAMRDAGYDDAFSLAVTGASSTIGPIIPPSVPMIMYGVVAGVSIGKLFLGGIIPGVIMALALCIYIGIIARKRGYPRTAKPTIKSFWISLKQAFFPLLTPVIIIGGMNCGLFTPTEAASFTALYATVLSLVCRDITIKDIPRFLKETTNSCIGIMIIVASASLFSIVLTLEQVPQKLSYFFLGNNLSPAMFMFLANLILIVVGMFMEGTAAITIMAPILAPVALAYGINPVYFGVVFILNLMIGLVTPPIGMVLYVLCNVGNITFGKVVKAIIPFVLILFLCLLFVILNPWTVTLLGN